MGAFLGRNLTLNMGGGFLGENLTHNMDDGGLFG